MLGYVTDNDIRSLCLYLQTARYLSSLEHHNDWVNDIVLCRNGKTGEFSFFHPLLFINNIIFKIFMLRYQYSGFIGCFAA